MALSTFFDHVPAGLVGLTLTFIHLDDRFDVFDESRARELPSWWREQLDEVLRPVGQGRIVLMVEEALPERDVVRGVPVQRVSMCIFEDGRVTPLTADQARHAYRNDPDTGRMLPPRTDRIFADFVLFAATHD